MAMIAAANGAAGAGASELDRLLISAIKSGENHGNSPLVVALEVARLIRDKGMELPSLELGHLIVSHLCFDHNTPTLWKLLDQALTCRLVAPIHVLALLTVRVIPCRREQPEAYRLYLELLSRYALSSPMIETGHLRDKISQKLNEALQLSFSYGVRHVDYGYAVVLFVLNVITRLIDCIIEDCGLSMPSLGEEGNSFGKERQQIMEIDVKGNSNNMKLEQREHLRQINLMMSIEVIEKISLDQSTKVIFRLIHLNMPEKVNGLMQKLQFLEAHRLVSPGMTFANNALENMHRSTMKAIKWEAQPSKLQLLGALVGAGPCSFTSCNSFGAGKGACWVSFDIFMESAMDGRRLYAISAADILTELTKTLQVLNQATWQETFQALWVSALRLIQRDREPVEGPMPHLDARLCMLLSIVPLAIVSIVKEDHDMPSYVGVSRSKFPGNEENQFLSRKDGLKLCLQLLGQYRALLLPPPSIVNAANDAATKAAVFVSNCRSANGNSNVASLHQPSIKAVGNMLHLIVEACIARNLIDTTAYFWPGYVVPSVLLNDSNSVQDSPWSLFLGGASLTSLMNSLMSTPATSLQEVEKAYHIAINGSDEEKSAAAKILCGASLVRGWNVQEHVVRIVVKLLSPPAPPDSSVSGNKSFLIDHMPVLNAVLFGVSCIDTVHILSLYGLLPEFAATLMPLCEAFGSLPPISSHIPSSSEEPSSVYTVFSCAFLCLLRLWKFYKPPQEYCIIGRGGSTRLELTLDSLLLLHNSHIAHENSSIDSNENNTRTHHASSKQPVYIDSFPKLQAWFFQNQACIASTLSGLCSKNPVHQVANKILNMLCQKMGKGGHSSTNFSSTSSSSASESTVNSSEDSLQRPILPAWEVLEAVPFVLEAVLTACAHGRLSSRDLITGLRDLVDFLPASLATIVSYFSAEVTRGIWKPVPMNGTDWPSPAAALLSVESEVKELLASAGVHIQSCHPNGVPPMLPLPMAALVSLTITFKIEKNSEYIRCIVGQALENCATDCTWPSMPVIGALWSQKVRRWHNFIVLSCLRSPFSRDKGAVTQLIRSCFSSFLGSFGTAGSHLTANRGINGFLGQALHENGVLQPIAPGFLYLKTCRLFHDPCFVSKVIFKMVIEWAHKLAAEWASSGPSRLKSSWASLSTASSTIQQVASLGASLLCIAGGAELVRVLYEETLPTMLLSAREEKETNSGPVQSIFEGYALAYMVIVCGVYVWGTTKSFSGFMSVFSSTRARIFGIHMDFIAGVVEGNILLGCDPATWKAYVSCFVGLLVKFAPAWIPEVKQVTLRKLADGLIGWHECDLALSLLEHGGPTAMTTVLEMIFSSTNQSLL